MEIGAGEVEAEERLPGAQPGKDLGAEPGLRRLWWGRRGDDRRGLGCGCLPGFAGCLDAGDHRYGVILIDSKMTAPDHRADPLISVDGEGIRDKLDRLFADRAARRR